MSISYRTASTQTSYLQYSATLGMMFLATEANRKEIARIKAASGDDWKRGFTGLTKGTVSGDARADLANLDIHPATIGGYIIDVNTHKNDNGASASEYLRIVLEGDDGSKINLSLDLSSNVAQQLIRKLANVSSSEFVQIYLFANLNQKGYAEHWVSVFAGPNADNLQKVHGIDPRVELVPAVNAALAAVKVTDKKVVRAIREATVHEFHVNLLTGTVIPAFTTARNDDLPGSDDSDDQSSTVVHPDPNASTLASTKDAIA